MDQQASHKLPISQQVRECLDAGMSTLEGSQYVGIYDDGFRLIANILLIAKDHPDSLVKAKAEKFLAEIDKRGSVGASFRAAYRFSMSNRIKRHVTHRKANKGLRLLKPREKIRIEELTHRSDLEENEMSEAKRIHASIVEDKITSVDYDKIRILVLKYVHNNQTEFGKKGLRKISNGNWNAFESLLNRADVSDADKNRVSQILEKVIEGDKMKTEDYHEAICLVEENKASKGERAKRIMASKTYEHAVLMACQACDNLDDMKMPVITQTKRAHLVVELSRAASNLLRLQGELLREKDDDLEDG